MCVGLIRFYVIVRGIQFHEYCSCALVSNLPNNDSDWPVSKYSVKLGHRADSAQYFRLVNYTTFVNF